MVSERVLSILLIEDEPAYGKIFNHFFPDTEFRFHQVLKLREAKEWLESNECDAILLDLRLPDSSDYETVKAISGLKRSAPVIVLTNSASELLESQATKAGAYDYLIKSDFTRGWLDSLSEVINKAVKDRKSDNCLHNHLETLRRAVEGIERARGLVANVQQS